MNRAKVEVHDYHRDGLMRTDGNYGGAPAYSPNSQGEWAAQPDVMELPLNLEGALYAYDPQDDPTDDCFRAGSDLWRVMEPDKRDLLIENTVENMEGVTENIKYRHAVHCYWADKRVWTPHDSRPWTGYGKSKGIGGGETIRHWFRQRSDNQPVMGHPYCGLSALKGKPIGSMSPAC